MGGCAALNCSNHSRNNFRMFKFPADEVRRKKWIENCRPYGWVPGPRAELCQHHFDFDQYEWDRKDGWRKLKPFAVPTLFGDMVPIIIDPPRKSPRIRQSFVKKQEQRRMSKLLPKKKCLHFSDLFSNGTLGKSKSPKLGESANIEETLPSELYEQQSSNVELHEQQSENYELYEQHSANAEDLNLQFVPIEEVESLDLMPTHDENMPFSFSQFALGRENSRINDKELMEQEAVVLRARIEMLNVENEMFKKKLRDLEKQEHAITEENESLQAEVLLFMRHNKGMKTVIMELQKHNNALSKRLTELHSERIALFEQISGFKEKHGDLSSKMKLSPYEKRLINKVKNSKTIDLTESDA